VNADQFELAFRDWYSRRSPRLPAPARIEATAAYVEGWEQRTRSLTAERDALVDVVEADPHRRGNYLLLTRIDALDDELWQLALVRHHVQRINAAAPAA
jgi:hypothetical protein